MTAKQKAFVIVSQSFFEAAIAPTVTHRAGNPDAVSHLMIGDVSDTNDPRGLWLVDVPSVVEKITDGSNVTFSRLLVPWQYVLSVGILEESGRLAAGFADATVLSLTNEHE